MAQDATQGQVSPDSDSSTSSIIRPDSYVRRSNSSHHSFEGEDLRDRSDARQIQLQIQQLIPTVAASMAKMDVTNSEVLRVTKAYRAFEGRAVALRVGVDAQLHHKSQRSEKISTFWSHSWHGGHWPKIITLIFLYNSTPAFLLGMLASIVSFFLFCLELLPGFTRDSDSGNLNSCWCLGSGFLVTCLVMIFWRPQSRIFLDRICISDTDVNLKTDAIFSLAGLLKASDAMLILWDPTWTERLWCLFELAAFLKSKKDQSQDLIIRPTFLGPMSVAVFLTASAALVPLTVAQVDARPSSMLLPAALIVCTGVGTAFIAVSIVRRYFRDLDTMKRQLQSISFDTARSGCCDCQHVSLDGSPLLCDREVVKQCVNVWFGSQETFENSVRSEVLDIVAHDLSDGVFTTKWALGLTMPIIWAFMDLAASTWNDWDSLDSLYSCARFLLQGLTLWLLVIPSLKDLLIFGCRLMRARPDFWCLEVLKNISVLLLVITGPLVIVVGCYLLSWVIPSDGPLEKAAIFMAMMLAFSMFSLLLMRTMKSWNTDQPKGL